MSSSEQLAWSAYADLPEHDRRLVAAWHDLGNDWMTSLLNSGVLGSVRRVHPDGAAVDEWSKRRLSPATPAVIRQRVCEHEAAHAIVAEHLGARVLDIEIVAEDSFGETTNEATEPRNSAVIAVAAQLWIEEHRWREFPAGDRGCAGDRRMLATHVDAVGEREAVVRARKILDEHGDQVLALASFLEENDLSAEPRREALVQYQIRLITGGT